MYIKYSGIQFTAIMHDSGQVPRSQLTDTLLVVKEYYVNT